jgi:hypothetical protein
MKKKDLNKLRMYDQVVQILEEHGTVWQSNVPFSEVYATFSEKLEGLKAYIESQHVLKGVHSVHKNTAQEALIKEAIRIEHLLQFYASKTENPVLLHDVSHTYSFWKRARENDRLLQGEHLRNLLEEHLSAATAYGLSQSDLDVLANRIASYSISIGGPRNTIVHRVHITEGISEIMAELDALLKFQMDNFVKALSESESNFVRLYAHARDVIRYKGKGKERNEPESGGENE